MLENTNILQTRIAGKKDLPEILEVYENARNQMKLAGNPNQWGDIHPPVSILQKNIQSKQLFVVERAGEIEGVFALIIGVDPTYVNIKGQWLNEKEYGTIHHIASRIEGNGIFMECLEFCFTQIDNIRIDTHEDNTKMQYLLEKAGFSYCGLIYVADGSPRKAYQLEKK